MEYYGSQHSSLNNSILLSFQAAKYSVPYSHDRECLLTAVPEINKVKDMTRMAKSCYLASVAMSN